MGWKKIFLYETLKIIERDVISLRDFLIASCRCRIKCIQWWYVWEMVGGFHFMSIKGPLSWTDTIQVHCFQGQVNWTKVQQLLLPKEQKGQLSCFWSEILIKLKLLFWKRKGRERGTVSRRNLKLIIPTLLPAALFSIIFSKLKWLVILLWQLRREQSTRWTEQCIHNIIEVEADRWQEPFQKRNHNPNFY